MFYDCSQLKEIDLTQFNTHNVNNMSSLFHECSSLEKITFGEFLDKCPNDILMDIYHAVQSELTARYLNQINFHNYIKLII